MPIVSDLMLMFPELAHPGSAGKAVKWLLTLIKASINDFRTYTTYTTFS